MAICVSTKRELLCLFWPFCQIDKCLSLNPIRCPTSWNSEPVPIRRLLRYFGLRRRSIPPSLVVAIFGITWITQDSTRIAAMISSGQWEAARAQRSKYHRCLLKNYFFEGYLYKMPIVLTSQSHWTHRVQGLGESENQSFMIRPAGLGAGTSTSAEYQCQCQYQKWVHTEYQWQC